MESIFFCFKNNHYLCSYILPQEACKAKRVGVTFME